MRRSISCWETGALVCTTMFIIFACTPGQRQAARAVIEVTTAACIVANAALPDEKVKQICGIVDAFDGPMKDLLKASREQAAANRCAPDGGVQ